jgi:4-hydroxy-tetrahydrodipicolinate synthase
MNSKVQIKGLWVPIITPFFQGQLDEESLVSLVKEIENQIDGFVPCLSSGEGGNMNADLWERVVKIVIENTNKPVAVGILNPLMRKIIELSEKAKSLGCVAVAIPLQGEDTEAQISFCKEISDKSQLPIILYNTEKIHIDTIDALSAIDQYPNIVSLKDSSQNQKFFSEAVRNRKEGKINLSILQGMENQLLESAGCDGYLISLANVEPGLCKSMLNNPIKEVNDEVMKKWVEFNLASETWFIGIKEALFARGKIKSAELIL